MMGRGAHRGFSAKQLLTPPVVMIVTTCALLLSLADYRAGNDGAGAAVHEPTGLAGAGIQDLALVETAASYQLVGPLPPAGWEAPQAASQAASQPEHRLPFDPLAVGPFRQQTEPEHLRKQKFKKLLATSQDEIQTVPYLRQISHRIRSGETISQVLDSAGVTPGEADRWVSAAKRVYNLNRVYAGQALSVLLDSPTSELVRLELDIDPSTMLVAEREHDDVVARREPIHYQRSLRVVGGTIESSLYMAAISKRIPDKIISEIAEILGWEINFGSDLRPGASFRVVYEELSREGSSEQSAGRVLAVEITNREKHYEGFYFAMPDGSHTGYYNRRGEGLGRDFLRYPVAFSRISSQFSRARFHPVLKRRVPHYGVDFAAPTGTPVKAAADGTILKSGWYGGNGRFIKIRHDAIYESGYAHLSRIAPGIKPRVKVKKGQVIGYVGSTGLATGPHLHFAMYRHGTYIDPLNADLPRLRSLSGTVLSAFRSTVDTMDHVYAHAGEREQNSTQLVVAAPRF